MMSTEASCLEVSCDYKGIVVNGIGIMIIRNLV